jgi:hypothetical protein
MVLSLGNRIQLRNSYFNKSGAKTKYPSRMVLVERPAPSCLD